MLFQTFLDWCTKAKLNLVCRPGGSRWHLLLFQMPQRKTAPESPRLPPPLCQGAFSPGSLPRWSGACPPAYRPPCVSAPGCGMAAALPPARSTQTQLCCFLPPPSPASTCTAVSFLEAAAPSGTHTISVGAWEQDRTEITSHLALKLQHAGGQPTQAGRTPAPTDIH